jgi:hypothetical protein
MRFAWLLNSDDPKSVKRVFSSRLTTMAFWAFNAVYFIFLLPYFTPIEYSTGFIALAIIILVRLIANVYANNFLEPEQFESFPFRIP